ncbi:MAG: 2,5-diamino-6-(ribosylamino)-4(3H)-pyrimidinone 5'-phosphate reductase [Desulfurococcales archaeon]|nr:2,5-diamino-6-(ribosylamino)-4(3H)-pyrimidinone 5'-phosphate reductase [Desulfurococcales archaeon]
MLRPRVLIFSTMALDGRIADPSGFTMLSCYEDFKRQHMLRAHVDAVMVGSNTVLKDDPRLTVRLAKGWSPYRVVVDSKLRIPLKARIFANPRKAIVLTSKDAPPDKLRLLKDMHVNVIVAGGDKVDLGSALRILRRDYGVRRLMVEGGGRLNCALLRDGLVDEVYVTVSPTIFGAGVSLFHGEETCKADLALIGVEEICGGWVSLRYLVVKR